MSRMCRVLVTVALALTGLSVLPSALASPAGPLPRRHVIESVYPVTWQGESWTGEESPVWTEQPAPSHWLAGPTTTYVDAQGHLHLVARKINGTWYCAAVTTKKSNYGYGTYRYVVETPLGNFDANSVVGMFTYNDAPANGHQEVDVELSRWSIPADTAPNAQYVVQPWKETNHLLRFNAPTDIGMTYEYTWKPSGVVFRIRGGTTPDAPVIKKWRTKADPGVPEAGTHVNLNMWLYRGRAPYWNVTTQEVVFDSFTYKAWSPPAA